MIRSAITISLVPEARGGPFVYWDGLAAGCANAAALGFDAVEAGPLAAGVALGPGGPAFGLNASAAELARVLTPVATSAG